MKKITLVILIMSLAVFMLSAQNSPITGLNTNVHGINLETSIPSTVQSPPPSGFWFGHNNDAATDAETADRSGWFSHNTNDAVLDDYGFAGFYETGHRYLPSHLEALQVQGMLLTQLTIHLGAVPPNLGVRVYTGGTDGNHLGVMEIDQAVPNPQIGWNVVELNTPVSIPADGELWFTYYVQYTSQIFAHSVCQGPGVPNFGNMRRLADSGPITPNTAITTNFMIRGFAVPGGPTGTLTGTVTSGGNPVPDALITIVGTTLTAMTNATGQYTRSFIPVGTYSVTAEKFGFVTATNSNVVITDGGTTTSNFTLTASPQVTVSGSVIGSDTNTPLFEAMVMLTGPATYGPVPTNASGAFTIPGVTASAAYNISISKYGYNTYSEIIAVGTTNLNLGTITLLEFAYAPRDVVATQESMEAVHITWLEPYIPPEGLVEFTHATSEEMYDAIGNGGFIDGEMTHRYSIEQLASLNVAGKQLIVVDFMLGNYSPAVSQLEIKIYTGGSGAPLQPGNLVHTQAVPVSNLIYGLAGDIAWNEVILSSPVTIPTNAEMWISISFVTSSGWVAACDAGPPVMNFGNVCFWPGYDWTTMNVLNPDLVFNWMIRGTAVDTAGNTVVLSQMASSIEDQLGITTTPISYDDRVNGTISFGEMPTISGASSRNIQMNNNIRNRQGNRAHTGYNVYRALLTDAGNPALWTTLAANLPITQFSFTDNTWGSAVEMSRYVWIVRAVYTNNNLSVPVLSNPITKFPEGYVYVGDPGSTLRVTDRPLPTGWETGVTQVIYPAEEIPIAGLIHTIQLNHNRVNASTPNAVYNIWLANSTKTSFASGTDWVPYDEFTLVYNGTIPEFMEPDPRYVTIELQTPFVYTGESLVFMGHREFLNIYSPNNSFLHTSASSNRTLGMVSMSDNVNPPFISYPTGSTAANFANIALLFHTADTGHITGTVTSGGNPVAGALVTIVEADRTTTTNAAGQYTIQYVPIGTYTVTAERFGYITGTNNNVVIEDGETTTSNFVLAPAATVSVTGTLIASDTDAPLEGASISLSGPASYGPVNSNASGVFTFPAVTASASYTMTITSSGYVSIIESIEVGVTNLNLGTIIVYEDPIPPRSVIATEVDANTINVSWIEPYIIPPGTTVFSHVQGDSYDNAIGAEGGPAVQFTTAMRFEQSHLQNFQVSGKELNSISFWPNNTGNMFGMATFTLKVWTGGSGSPLSPGTEVLSQPIPAGDVNWNEWNTIPLNNPITIPTTGELWIGYLADVQQGYVASVANGTVMTGLSDVIQWGGNWTTLTAFGLTSYEGWLLRGTAVDAYGNEILITPISYSLSEKLGLDITYQTIDSRSRNDAPMVNIQSLSQTGFNIPLTRNTFGNNTRGGNRAHLAYNVYRSTLDNANNPALWTTLATNIPHVENQINYSLNDPAWGTLETNESYVWIVRAVYTNNNLSIPVYSNIMDKWPEGLIYIGDPHSTIVNVDVPFQHYYMRGVSQTIYLEEEIQVGGLLTSIYFEFNGTGSLGPDAIHEVYIGTTDKNVFSNANDWVPLADFTLVYSGTLPVNIAGWQNIVIDFDVPFVYGGGNLVIMTNKLLYQWSSNQNWRHTASGGNRSMWARTDSSGQYDLDNIGAGSMITTRPNIALFLDSSGMGDLQGVVTTGTPAVPVAGAEIVVNGQNRSTFTNDQGEYLLRYLYEGTHTLTANRHGFQETVVTNVIINENQITTRNFTMTPLPSVTVSGIIRGSDTLEGLSGAEITITGYEDYEAETNASGNFSIPGVYSGFTYTITVRREGYLNHVNQEFVVGSAPVNVDIILEEVPFPPINPHAEIVGTAALITWDEPDGTFPGGEDVWFTQGGDGPLTGAIGLQDSGPFVSIGIHRFTQEQLQTAGVAGADLTRVEFWANNDPNWPGPGTGSFTFKAYTGGSANPYNPGTEIYSEPIPPNVITWNDWTEYELSSPVPIPTSGEFWFGFEANVTSGRIYGLGMEPTVTGFGNVFQFNGDWTDLMVLASIPGNWMLRGMASGATGPTILSHIPNDNLRLPIESINARGENLQISENSASRVRSTETRIANNTVEFTASDGRSREISQRTISNSSGRASRLARTERPSEDRIRQNNRALEGYNLYRASIFTLDDESTWLPIANNLTDTEFLDESWASVDTGAFRYAIKAIYTNDVFSMAALTNIVSKNMTSRLHIELYTFDEEPVNGAIVRLVNNLGTEHNDQVYEQVATGTVVLFPEIWHGTYTLTVTLDPYLTYTNTALSIQSDTEYGVFLHDGSGGDIDLIFPARHPVATLANNDRDVVLTWQAPILGNPIGYRVHKGGSFITEVITAMTFTETNVTPGIYTYSVVAVFETGYAPDASAPPITVPGPPPRNLEATLVELDETYNVLLTWEAPLLTPTGYKVFRDDDMQNPLEAGLTTLSFTDTEPPSGDRTYYVVATYTPTLDSERVPVEIHVPPSSDGDITINISATALTGNFPNPFNPSTTIQFDIKEEGIVRIDIFNIRGQRVNTLVNDFMTTGRYNIDWYGVDDNGRDVASGVYFYRMQAEGFTDVKRMLLMK
ncbi:MAG: carboxypeptidase regulatory-like domain-containing protein [Candidatus Cloacimonetes bacterium]|nr:carboxypeptidase regulatory-like domain-containing protein [Candidatus Cloacimonadota bacterium]